jgi:hypothetical protein
MADMEPDLREQLGRIDRQREEAQKLSEERLKLTVEQHKLAAEAMKLLAEGKNFERERLTGWVAATAALLAAIAAVTNLLHGYGRI